MPNLKFTLTNIGPSVSRPIVFDIIKQVQEITNIPKDTDIFYPDSMDKMSTPGSNIEDQGNRLPNFNSERRTFIEVESDYDPYGIATMSSSDRENLPIFYDKSLGIRLAPIYSSDTVTINFKYVTHSKGEALRWRDDIRMRVSMLRDINLHDVSYHYILNKDIVYILHELYTKREANLGYSQTFEQYITSFGSSKLTITSDLVAKNIELAIAETQVRIVGIFNFEGAPEKPQKEDNGTWTISFSYRFNYDRPIGCNLRYPIMVHNQLIDSKYTEHTNKVYRLDKVNKVFSNSFHAMNAFESDSVMNTRIDPTLELRIPEFDDYVIPGKLPDTGTVWLALCEIDDQDKRSLLNLNELGDLAIDKDVLDFILKSEYPYIGKEYQSILQLSLYRGDYLASSGSLDIDSLGNVKASKNLDLRVNHRVRFSVVTDLSKLPKSAIDRLRGYPEAFKKIVGAINELLRNHPDLNDMGRNGGISRWEFDTIYRLIVGRPWTSGDFYQGGNNWHYNRNEGGLFKDIPKSILDYWRSNRVGRNTVMTTGIIALPMK